MSDDPARSTEAQYRFLSFMAEKSRHAIAYFDRSGRCRLASAAYERLVERNGRGRRERPWEVPQRTPFLEAQQRAVESGLKGEVFQEEKSWTEPDGRAVHILLESYPDVETEGAPPHGVLLLISDLSTLQTAKENLRKMDEMLVDHAQAAQRASAAKTSFLMNVSHELRTPLNAILGICFLLRSPANEEDRLRLVARMDGAARHLLGIIENVIDLERISSENLALNQELFSLRNLTDEIEQAIPLLGSTSEITVRANFPKELRVVGDRARLHQVIFHLLDNAIKFSKGSAVHLLVEEISRATRTTQVRFTVTDFGTGIPKESLPAVFEAFTQADASSTRKYGGVGLGLTLVSHLVAMMGGEVHVESLPGKGSRFRFELTFPVEWAETGMAPRRWIGLLGNLDRSVRSQCISLEFSTHTLANVRELFESTLDYRRRIDVVVVSATSEVFERPPMLQSLILSLAPFLRPKVLVIGEATEQTRQCADLHLNAPRTRDELRDAILSLLDKNLPSPKLEAGAGQQLDLENRHILVVDDSQLNLTVATRILEKFRGRVVTALDGQKALDILADDSQPIDVILMDVQMPGMDGNEATRRIRANPLLKHIPIIGVSAGTLEVQQGESFAAGMNGFITKPFRPEEMVTEIMRCFPLIALSRETQHRNSPPSIDLDSLDVKSATLRVPGVDLKEAMTRLVDDPAFILSLIQGFITDFQQLEDDFVPDVSEAGLLKLERFLHKIRGAAGNLAIHRVAAKAADIEIWTAGVGRDLSIPDEKRERLLKVQMNDLRDAFREVRSGIPLSKRPPAPLSYKRPDGATLESSRMIFRLRSALARRNFEAVELFESSASALREMLGAEVFAVLEAAVMQLDFRRAEEVLK